MQSFVCNFSNDAQVLKKYIKILCCEKHPLKYVNHQLIKHC